MNKITISPSLLAADFLHLGSQIRDLNEISDLWYHLDIMDGHFVPNLSYGTPVIKSISKVAKHPLDAHLMVTNPQLHIDLLKTCNIHNFTFHLESVTDHLSFIKKCKSNFPSIGISIKPSTKVEQLSDDILNQIDLVLVMSVEPGFGGQSFMPECLYKIKWLQEKKEALNTKYSVQVDGGINSSTAPLVLENGADNLVSGSYILGSHNKLEAIEMLRS